MICRRLAALAVILLPAIASAQTVKLALTGPFTGGSAPMGGSFRDGAKIAVAEINAAGGIQVGRQKLPIEVVERDDEAKNERGALIAQEIAVLEPDHLGAPEEGEGLESLAEAVQGGEGLAAVAGLGADDLVIHPAGLVTPLLIKLPGAQLDAVIIVATHQGEWDGHRGGGGRHGAIRLRRCCRLH